MISFVNAKINIGLQIVRRRPDGYHDLQTVFYPVGLYAGTPENPSPFCDILEITKMRMPGIRFTQTGSGADCADSDNLVVKAAKLFFERRGYNDAGVDITLDKHLPFGAGMGGGSADAAFTLRMLADLEPHISDEELAEMALQLGADAPFFIYNTPMYAEGVGEKLESISLNLAGMWLVVAKPDIYVSTREAFAGVTPKAAEFDLRKLPNIPIQDWKGLVHNDFEDSIFPKYPAMREIKDELYRKGARYASLTGSGSCIYGIFDNIDVAKDTESHLRDYPTIQAVYLLKM